MGVIDYKNGVYVATIGEDMTNRLRAGDIGILIITESTPNHIERGMLLIENSIFSIVSDTVGHAYEGFGRMRNEDFSKVLECWTILS